MALGVRGLPIIEPATAWAPGLPAGPRSIVRRIWGVCLPVRQGSTRLVALGDVPMVPCLDGGLLPIDQPIDQSILPSTHPSNVQIATLQSWLEQRLASLEAEGAFEDAYALRMEMADWLLAEAG